MVGGGGRWGVGGGGEWGGACLIHLVDFLSLLQGDNLHIFSFIFLPTKRYTLKGQYLFPDEEWYTEKQTGSHKTCLSCQKGRKSYRALRKRAYSNIKKNLSPKTETFQIKNSDIFHISAQNIDCGYSLEPPRLGGFTSIHNLCFWTELRKIMYSPVNPSFTI